MPNCDGTGSIAPNASRFGSYVALYFEYMRYKQPEQSARLANSTVWYIQSPVLSKGR